MLQTQASGRNGAVEEQQDETNVKGGNQGVSSFAFGEKKEEKDPQLPSANGILF